MAVVDAKSVFETPLEQCAGSKQDRRTAIDLSLLRQTFKNTGTLIRWIPHPRMLFGIMTKSDVSRGNAALTELLRTGRWRPLDEAGEIRSRREGDRKKPEIGRASCRERV